MRKRLCLVLLFLVIVFSLMGSLGCKQSEIVLVDFPATASETVELGYVYKLRTLVKDDKGTTYPVAAKVQTSGGIDVPILANQFLIEVVDGYKISYSADLGDGQTKESVVTLEVVDNFDPIINIATPNAGTVNVQYTLPDISITSFSPIQEKQITVSYVKEETSDNIALVEDGDELYFIPEKAGIYNIIIYVKTANKEVTVKKEFYVAAAEEIFNAGEPFAEDRLESRPLVGAKQYRPGDVGYDGSGYGGAYISFSENLPQEWTYFVFKTLIADRSPEFFENYDYVSMWFYGKTKMESDPFVFIPLACFSRFSQSRLSNTWVNVKVEMKDFIAAYYYEENGVANPYVSKSLLSVDFSTLDELRIGNVTAINGETSPADTGDNIKMLNECLGGSVNGTEIISFDNEYNTISQIANVNRIYWEWLSADDPSVPEGAYGGVGKFKFGWEWPSIYFKPAAEKALYENCTHIMIRMYFEENMAEFLRMEYANDNDCGEKIWLTALPNQWFEVIVPADEFLRCYEDYEAGNRGLFFCQPEGQKLITMYIDGIYAYNVTECEIIPDESMLVQNERNISPVGYSTDPKGVEGVVVEYKNKDADDSTYTQTVPTQKGEYIVRFSLNNENCSADTVTKLLIINDKYDLGSFENHFNGWFVNEWQAAKPVLSIAENGSTGKCLQISNEESKPANVSGIFTLADLNLTLPLDKKATLEFMLKSDVELIFSVNTYGNNDNNSYSDFAVNADSVGQWKKYTVSLPEGHFNQINIQLNTGTGEYNFYLDDVKVVLSDYSEELIIESFADRDNKTYTPWGSSFTEYEPTEWNHNRACVGATIENISSTELRDSAGFYFDSHNDWSMYKTLKVDVFNNQDQVFEVYAKINEVDYKLGVIENNATWKTLYLDISQLPVKTFDYWILYHKELQQGSNQRTVAYSNLRISKVGIPVTAPEFIYQGFDAVDESRISAWNSEIMNVQDKPTWAPTRTFFDIALWLDENTQYRSGMCFKGFPQTVDWAQYNTLKLDVCNPSDGYTFEVYIAANNQDYVLGQVVSGSLDFITLEFDLNQISDKGFAAGTWYLGARIVGSEGNGTRRICFDNLVFSKDLCVKS